MKMSVENKARFLHFLIVIGDVMDSIRGIGGNDDVDEAAYGVIEGL